MDGFTAALIGIVLVFMAGFGAGRFLPMGDVAQDINIKGEVVIRSTVYQCQPTASIINGRRVPLQLK
jgi:hypothetical protein